MYQKKPSEILCPNEDEYTQFCFDEACWYIQARLDSGDKIEIKQEYKSASEMYAQYGY